MMVSGIVVAAGKGKRMGATIRKQYIALAGRSILGITLQALDRCRRFDRVFLVVPEEDFAFCRERILTPLSFGEKVVLVGGGKERQDSVYHGLLAAEKFGGIVLIHDGVRPFVDPETVAECIETAKHFGACIAATRVTETVKKTAAPEARAVERTLDRETLWIAQTPQAFRYELIRRAHEAARRSGVRGTDDALLVEQMGEAVRIVPGSRFNIKITTPEDLQMAEAILSVTR
ncbi:MAG: 2-C-methyl-D-erythritol 4-phosphate cytidylyltransferase [Desulfobacteraceae bacterium]|nr:MAG: 2-C-methyl-D-erythritol 4-phosphate cytidylyltransferase [Desulfobacteraceae bacterium]